MKKESKRLSASFALSVVANHFSSQEAPAVVEEDSSSNAGGFIKKVASIRGLRRVSWFFFSHHHPSNSFSPLIFIIPPPPMQRGWRSTYSFHFSWCVTVKNKKQQITFHVRISSPQQAVPNRRKQKSR